MRALRCLVASASLVLALGVAAPAVAQEGGTTTTVPAIPVTGGGDTRQQTTNAAPLASTGLAADALVPFAFGLIALGGGLEALARRRRLALPGA